METNSIISKFLPYVPYFIKGMLGLIFVIGLIVLGIVKTIKVLKKNDFYGKKRTILISICYILVVLASWFLNMGWIRFFMTFLLIPFIHAVVFFLTNFFVTKYFDKSTKIKKLNIWFIISYLIAYLLMPDGGDIGGMYFFFGLIHNDTLSGIANSISSIAVIVHIVMFIMQIVEIKKIKKNISINQ